MADNTMTGAMVRLPDDERDRAEAWAKARGIDSWQQMCRTLMMLGLDAEDRDAADLATLRGYPANAAGKRWAA